MKTGIKTLYSKRGDEALRKILDSDAQAALQREGKKSQEVERQVVMIPIDDIAPNPFQPRKHFDTEKLATLAKSFKDQGILQPVTLRETTESSGSRYELIFGERRLRAAKEAGMTEIPAIVKNVDDEHMKILTLIENLQREDLNVVEKMLSICELNRELGDTAVTAKAVKLTRRSIERYVRVFKILSSSKNVLSFFKRNSHLIDFNDAETLAEIVPSLQQKEINKFLDLANREGVKNAIKLFLKSTLAMQEVDRVVSCRIKDTAYHVSLQMKYLKGSLIAASDLERIQETFEDFLMRLK